MNGWMQWSRLVLCIPFIVLFGGVLISDHTFVFRDSAHFYYPLFQWIDSEWRSGRVPLWNPLENTGVPTLADASSSVFYPGKLLFLLPLGFGFRYKLYIVLHVLLAQGGAFRLARNWGASFWGASLCGVAYAFSGNVAFQHCNVVFLVGAAWLPAALLLTDSMLVQRSLRHAVWLGVVLALTVLGGDPQTGYHVGLAAALYAVMLWRTETVGESLRRLASPSLQSQPVATLARAWGLCHLLRNRICLLAVAAVVGIVFSAVQIFPAWEWAAQSSRTGSEKPLNIYAAISQLPNGANVVDGLLKSPTPGTHHRHIYEFSVGPWRWAEFLWPNFSGRMFPEDHRWLDVLPAEDRVWSPSNYLGLLPLLCGLFAWRVRGGTAQVRWLSWLTLLAMIGACGWFGLGWLIDEVQFWFTRDPHKTVGLGQPVGGLYWLLVVCLPGYSYFRFPAKLLVIASLVLSLLAARGFDALLQQPSRGMRKMLAVLGSVSLVAMCCVFVIQPTWQLWFDQQLENHSFHTSVYWYGPLVPSGATHDLMFAFASTGVLCFAFRWLLKNLNDENRSRRAFWLLAITAVEITLANHWLVPLAPESIVRQPPLLQAAIARDFSDDTHVPRVFRSPAVGTPRHWWTSSSPRRLVDNFAWDHDTLFPKHHLPWSVGMVETLSTLQSQDYAIWLAVCRQNFRTEDGQSEQHQLASWLSANYLILPTELEPKISETTAVPIPPDAWLNSTVALHRNNTPLPRAWIVHDVTVIDESPTASPAELVAQTTATLFPNGQPRDLLKSAVVERPRQSPPLQLPSPLADGSRENRGRCEWILDSPQRIEIDVQLEVPGLLILNDLHFPGWHAYLQTDAQTTRHEVPVWRTNRIMRGVLLPPGNQRVTFAYSPRSFWIGAFLSGTAWILLIASGLWSLRRSK